MMSAADFAIVASDERGRTHVSTPETLRLGP
jgi:hypothetical protein